MISFIKNYSLENIKYKFIILYLLNVLDIFFTLLLLSTNLYIEANILMIRAVQNPIWGIILKVIFPAILFIFIYLRMKKATNNQLKQSNFLINCAIILYIIINTFHLIGFAVLPALFYIYK
ncbi:MULTISPECIES: DUF5658 family protein [unclassified Clostridium]|uniref:DUF5658 family protein n=1 Tax=unclassified Clostridium TaxID=2614128 RepID=UPI0002983D68|nr:MULTISPECIES: DUF5658 family protein [unclassified Clostridium]EKQ57444.1 MAG: hypothetical protein A370_00916 [Clostridium sp. Maddingley MBC34-26]